MNQLLLVALCQDNTLRNLFLLLPWYECVYRDRNDPTKLLVAPDPKGAIQITQLNDVMLVAFTLVEDLMKLSFLVAAGYMFFMIFKIVLARGDTKKVSDGLNGIRDAVIGFVIALSSVAIVNFIGSTLK
jgi:hypothetical protein